MNRRDVLRGFGIGAATLWLPRRTTVWAQAPADTASGTPGNSPTPGRLEDLSRIGDLAERIRRASREGAFDVAASAITAGATPATLIGAAFLAGIQEIRPRSVGGKLHAVMMVESAFQLVDRLPPRDTWTAALWTLDDCKVSQQRDVREAGDWTLPPRPEVSFTSEVVARRELLAALGTWEEEKADRALVGLLEFSSPAQIFELLWPAAMRSYTDIGHKIIFATQVQRALGRIGADHAEPALRSLVNGLLYRDEQGQRTETFATARAQANAMPTGWLAGREDPEESLGLLLRLRDTSPERAQTVVVEAFTAGLGPATVWDGLRLWATELFQRRPRSAARRHGPVHPVTELNAFHHVWRTTSSEETRRLAILQGAAWLALLREDLKGFFGAMEGPGVDTLAELVAEIPVGQVPSLGQVFEEPSALGARAWLDHGGATGEALLTRLRAELMTRANQSHQYKYLAAVQEEAALTHPRWANTVLAPAVTYLPTPGDPETETWKRTRRVLEITGRA